MASPLEFNPTPPRTALVLSSGGLFGAYQAGAWRCLAESGFCPDIIVGASVGALNGWAIAGGCASRDLTEMWLDEARSNVLKRSKTPGFRKGFFERGPLSALTTDIFSSYGASTGFGLVVVQLPYLRSRLITGASITAEHLLATASIPLAMPSVAIDGKTYTDGGLLEDVPLWAAVKMGATKIVAIDAMNFDCPWWYRACVSPTNLFAPRVSSAVRSQVMLIRPKSPLGHFSTALNWDRSRIQNWIDRGHTDAQRVFSGETRPVVSARETTRVSVL